LDTPGGKARLGQSRKQDVIAQRTGCPEGIAANPKNNGVSTLQHTRRIRKNIGTSLEDERNDPEWRTPCLHVPTIVFDHSHPLIASQIKARPHGQARHHVGTHLRGQLQSTSCPTALLGIVDIEAICLKNWSKHGIISDLRGKQSEEVVDLPVSDKAQLSEGNQRTGHGFLGYRRIICPDVQQLPPRVHGQKFVPLTKLCRQRLGDRDNTVSDDEAIPRPYGP
jgi:hypothetical protein